MPRSGWIKIDTDQRLSDHISWALLHQVFPPAVVDQVIADCGRRELRSRLLPSRVVVYYVMGLALFSQASYEEVMDTLLAHRAWSSGWSDRSPTPTKAALFKARARLGSEPLASLFAQVARPMEALLAYDHSYKSLRLMSLDLASLDVPDTQANVDSFGRGIDGERGPANRPRVQVVGLTETATKAITAAVLGAAAEPKQHLAAQLLPHLGAGMLLLAGPELFSRQLLVDCAATGAHVLWSVPNEQELPVLERYDDGSYRSRLVAADVEQTSGASPIQIRVVEHRPPGEDQPGPLTTHRFATTIADPVSAPAADLAALYSLRWQIASAFDELRAHHLSPRAVLRSKVPDGVRQEVYGYLCVHYALRWLMHGPGGDPPPTAYS